MSDAPGSARSTGSVQPDEQFTVPVPAAPTQALPVFEPTGAPRGEPTRALPVPPSPYAAQPAWPAATPTARPLTPDGAVDPLIGQIGVALFWVTVGWWLFFVIRLLGYLTRRGATDTIVIRTIDFGAEETITAAVLSVLAALLLLLGRGRAGRSPLGWASLALAVVTVGIAVWRLLP